MQFLLAFLLALCSALTHAQHIQIALIDTTLRTAESYHALIRAGAVMQMSIKHMVPTNYLATQAAQSDAYIVVLDKGLLTHPEAYYTTFVREHLSTLPKKPVTILLTNEILALDQDVELISEKIAQLFDCSEDHVLDAFDEFIVKQRDFKPLYTTLYESAENAPKPSKFPRLENVKLLPQENCSHVLAANMPLAVLIERGDKPFIAISTLAIWTFPDFEEQRRINPLSMRIRKELFKAVIDTLVELKSALINKPVHVHPEAVERLVKEIAGDIQHEFFCKLYKEKSLEYNWTCNGSAIGWLGFDLDDAAIKRNLELLALTDLDGYWLEIPMKHFEPSERTKLFARLTEFRKHYATAFAEKPHAPKMLLDPDLASLMSWQDIVQYPVDIYGRAYEQLPAPLDYEGFWKRVFIKSVDQLIQNWKADKNSVAIDGIVINFYLWIAKKEMPFYSNLLDFSDTAWRCFVRTFPQDQQASLMGLSVEERIKYVFENNVLVIYQECLEQEATRLGEQLAADLRALIDDAILGGFIIVPLNTWFYKGLLRGMSSAERPIILLSDDVAFYNHKAWYENNGIFALHHTSVPMAKFNNDTDIELINELLKHHDGAWYSKISRLGQPYEKGKWWSGEATSQDINKVIKLINKQVRK